MAILNSSIFSRRSFSKNAVSGYTLIELLVVITIIAVLSSILLGYSRESGRQLLLTTTRAKMLSLVSRAKFLSVEVFFQNQPSGKIICGYGVHVDQAGGEVFIFRDIVDDTDNCTNSDRQFSPGERVSGELSNISLDTRVLSIDSSTDLSDVVFVPPNPDVHINAPAVNVKNASINVKLLDGIGDFTITVNDAGQVETD